MVSELDRNIGRIVDSVAAAGLLNRTIFVVTADHGDYLGDHNMTGKSAIPYDGAMRIPLIFSGPGVPEHVRAEEVADRGGVRSLLARPALFEAFRHLIDGHRQIGPHFGAPLNGTERQLDLLE